MKVIEIYDGTVNNIADYFPIYLKQPYKYVSIDETKETLPKIGDKYNYSENKFESSTINKILTKTQFRDLFTLTEKVMLLPENISSTIDKYSNLVDINKKEEAKQILKVILIDLDAASEVDLSHPNLVQSINYIATLNLISKDRANMILNNISPS